jgi:hypothetical protein
MRRRFSIGVLMLSSLLGAAGGDVALQWDPNSESDLAGYRVYDGGRKIAEVVVGTTRSELRGLLAGRHVFTVTAFNHAGLESEPSVGVVWDSTMAPTKVSTTIVFR